MNVHSVDEIIDGLQKCAVAVARDNKRVVKFVLARFDYDRAYDALSLTAGPVMPGEPAFKATWFNLHTAAGAVRVEPSDDLPAGEARVELGLKSRGRAVDAVYESVKDVLERHYGPSGRVPPHMQAVLLRLEAIAIEERREIAEKPRYSRSRESVVLQFADRWVEFDVGIFSQSSWEAPVRAEIQAAFRAPNLGRHPGER